MAGIDHKQRMLAGLPYQANGGSLPAERDACARLLHEYNTLPPERWDERDVLIRKILGQVGEGIEVRPPFDCDYGANMTISQGILAERRMLAEIREHANVIIDTSNLKPIMLREELRNLFSQSNLADGLAVTALR